MDKEHNEESGISANVSLVTPEGRVPVDWLREGDRVETRHHGFQTILRIETFERDSSTLVDGMSRGVLRGQRLLAGGWPIELFFGHDAMLVEAAQLGRLQNGRKTFARIFMRAPMLIAADDLWIESHGTARASLPVMADHEVDLTRHVLGCPLVRRAHQMPEPHSTTFGSQVAVA